MATSSDTFESWSGHPKPESVDDHKQPEIHTLLGFDVAKANDRSWRAPAFMLGSLVTGLGIAVAHHFMCWSLNGRAVADVAISQAWTSRFGTALAFLVKAAFTISIGTAYVQHQWLTLHQKSFRTDEVDALTSVLGSVFSFLTSAVWLKHPLLALIALIAWLIPLATIVAPGSLTVAPAEFSRVIDTQVPQPDFSNDTNFGLKNDMNPLKPDVRINKIAYQVATSGRSVPLVPEFSNSTYHLDFDAPAVRCAPANESIVRKRTVDFGPTTNYGRGVSVTSFASWTGPYLTDRDDHDSLDSATFFTFDLDYQSTDAARVFVMTNKGQRAWDNFLETDEPEIFWKRIVNVTECLLYNASYSVDFIFKDGVQTQDLSISKWMNPIPLDVRSWMGNTAKLKPYAAMMQAFGSLLVGKNSVQATAGVLEEDTSSARKMLDVDWDDTEALPGSLERLFHDLTLSVPSNEELLVGSSNHVWRGVPLYPWLFSNRTLLFFNDTSYQNIFSTYVRASNDLELRLQVGVGDTGADPLPRKLARFLVTFSGVKMGSLDPEAAQNYSARSNPPSVHDETASLPLMRRNQHDGRDLVAQLERHYTSHYTSQGTDFVRTPEQTSNDRSSLHEFAVDTPGQNAPLPPSSPKGKPGRSCSTGRS